MKIEKRISSIGSTDIRIYIDNSRYLDVIFGGNGDIYWIYDNTDVIDFQNDSMYESFSFNKGDKELYEIFNRLYEDLINCNIYIPEKIDSVYLLFDPNANVNERKRCLESNTRIKSSSKYTSLIKDGVISWYSDEECHDIAEILRISKKDDFILIEFVRQSLLDDMGFRRIPGNYSVRIRTDGSSYSPCDIVFWRCFDELQKLSPDKFNLEQSDVICI